MHDVHLVRDAGTNTGQPYPYTVPQKSWDHNAASASYNALQASLARRFSTGLGYTIAYTWSKTLDEGGDGYFGVEGGVPEDPYNPKGSRGPASFDIPQILTANTNYELPFGTGKRFSTGNRFADYAIGNWQLNGIFSARSGQHLNITAAGDIANTGNGGAYERADLLGDPFQTGPIAGNPSYTPPSGPTRTRTQWFNPCAFKAPNIGTLGDAPRNFIQAQITGDWIRPSTGCFRSKRALPLRSMSRRSTCSTTRCWAVRHQPLRRRRASVRSARLPMRTHNAFCSLR
jgi:hypothetical protein